jgi:N-acetylmuramoyl-L-alanine amidase
MKIGVNIGHIGTQGAVGFLNESACNVEIAEKLVSMLTLAGHTVVDCSVPAKNGVQDYVLSTQFANKQGLNLLISIHCNSFSDPAANGTEVLHPVGRDSKLARAVSASVAKKLGTYDRGAKATGSSVYIVDKSVSDMILVEGFFVSNESDCEKYDPTRIAEGIAEVFGYKAAAEENQNGSGEEEMPDYLLRKYQYCDNAIPFGLKDELWEAVQAGIVSYGDEGFDPPLSEQDVRTLVWIKRGRA